VGVSIASIPIIGWIAAIVTALISIAVTVEEFVETSAEKTERLRKEAEAARQAAEDATAAYEELMSSWDQYGDTQKTLHELIKGTDEWKRALVDANNEVLKLLGTYPELAKYIETGEFGQLIINEKGWKEIAEK
jgi:hypothetical protein